MDQKNWKLAKEYLHAAWLILETQKIQMELTPTGKASYFFDQHYQNQTPLYLAGEYRKQRMNRKDILANKTSRLIFRP